MAAQPIRTDYISGVWTYLLSIDWEETWLWMLMTFHLWCIVFTLLSILYKKYYPQIGLFIVYLALAFSSEFINEWAAVNYKLFSNQQYFDSNGMFISFLFSLPLLTNSLVIVVYWMWDITKIMINLKSLKVKQKKQAEKQEAANKALTISSQKLQASRDVGQAGNTSEQRNEIQETVTDKSPGSKKAD